MIEFKDEYALSQDSVASAVYYMDRYLSEVSIEKTRLQLLGMVSIFVATKVHEVDELELCELCELAGGMYTQSDVMTMERELLRVIQWRLNPVLPHAVVTYLLHYVEDERLRPVLYRHAIAIINTFSKEYESIQYQSSTIGVVAIVCAFSTTDNCAFDWIKSVRVFGVTDTPHLITCTARMQRVT
jgi:hypothetical protein